MEKGTIIQRQLWITVITVALLALVLGIWLHTQSSNKSVQSSRLQNGTMLPKPYVLNSFQLTDDQGRPFTNDTLRGHWSLLFFGFTHCPMMCPTTLAKLNDAYKELRQLDNENLPQVVFISIDPDRDSAKQIKYYLSNFNDNFVGATGSKGQLKQLTQSLGIVYMKAIKSGEEDYNIEHSGSILVINPLGEWVAVLSPPQDGHMIAQEFMRIQTHF